MLNCHCEETLDTSVWPTLDFLPFKFIILVCLKKIIQRRFPLKQRDLPRDQVHLIPTDTRSILTLTKFMFNFYYFDFSGLLG